MKTNLNDFPQFIEAIRSNELVYLFGTGISSALTNVKYSWWKWIVDGIHLLNDKSIADSLENSLTADYSTDNMVKVVGKVISYAKADGVYDNWMKQAFETNSIQNHTLAATLKKMVACQDAFVTTNYDLLLEQATGLIPLSYENTDIAFRMLEQKSSTHVLHIHGIYDSENSIDNIVADEEQYTSVLEDKGAQFIQNILGTRTLIFIGCGKTTEDANIAQFIQFSRTHLKLDIPYYFLYNSTQEFDDMPENIIMVPYGDDYADLPEFLENMIQTRLEFKLTSNPIVDKTIYSTKREDTYGLSEYHFSMKYLKFCGRQIELSKLRIFTESDAHFCWWAITGQGGSGKSRLAYEFMQQLNSQYCSFFLNSFASISEAKKFVPFNNTLVIIDYIKGNEENVAALVSCLTDIFEVKPYKLRIIFIERDNQLLSGSWYDILVSKFDILHRSKFRDSEYNNIVASRMHNFLYLDDLSDEAVLELIADVCRKKELPEDSHRDANLKKEYSSKLEMLRFRPLFIQMYVEAWINNGCILVDYQGYEDLLRNILKREQERILNLVNGDVIACGSLIRLLIRAGISGFISTEDLPDLYIKDWNSLIEYNKKTSLPGVQRKEQMQTILNNAGDTINADSAIIVPMYPDIIKEAMFLYYTDKDDLFEIGSELWENQPFEFMAFLSRTLIDFSDNDLLREFVRSSSANFENTYALQARFAILQNEVVHDKDSGKKLIEIVKEEFSFWKSMPLNEMDDENRKLIKLKGLNYCLVKLLGWNQCEWPEALDLIAGFENSNYLTPYKVEFLLAQAHYFTEGGAISKHSEQIVYQIFSLLKYITDEHERKVLWLRTQREHLVNLLHDEKFNAAKKEYKLMCKTVDMSNEQEMEFYSYATFSCVNALFSMRKFDKLLYYAYELQDCAEKYGAGEKEIYFNDKIHYYYLHSKAYNVEAVWIRSLMLGNRDYGLSCIDQLIEEISCNEMISDFSGLLVWMIALKVKADENLTQQKISEFILKTDELLDLYPDNELLVEKAISFWHTTYSKKFKCKVPASVVRKSYTLLLRFHKSISVIDAFFKMLNSSEEAGKNKEYFEVKPVISTLIQHKKLYYISPTVTMPETYIRMNRKIRANEPCPCGSGKKFKRCCKGKGIYY